MTAIGFILALIGWVWCQLTPPTNGQALQAMIQGDYDMTIPQAIGAIIYFIGLILMAIGVGLWLWQMLP